MARTELVALRDAITAHVQACFDREAAMFAERDSAKNVKVLDTIDWKDGWPGEGGTSPAEA